MALQTSVAVRVTIRGDGISKQIRLDLRSTLVQYVNASYVLLPVLPASLQAVASDLSNLYNFEVALGY